MFGRPLQPPAIAAAGPGILSLQTIALLTFVFAAFAIRVPLMIPFEIHTDENTFLNMGHDVALGHLPYLSLWDLKPPLLYILVAPITVFAHYQIWVVRLFATALDILTALIVKKTADRLFGDAWSHWFAAILCFAATTTWIAGGALMSETVALPFLMGGTFILCNRHPSRLQAFGAGLLFGAATLIRGTPAFSAVAVVAVLFGTGLVRRDWHEARIGLFMGIGGFCALALMILPYAAIGDLDMLARSAVRAPLAYVDERGRSSLLQLLSDMALTSRLSSLAFGLGFAGLIYGALARHRPPGLRRIGAAFIGQLIGLSVGPIGGFYVQMLVPFACVLGAPAVSLLLAMLRPTQARLALSAVLLLPLLLAAKNAVDRGRVHDTMAETFDMLSTHMGPRDTLYLTTDYTLYWLLDRTPPHPIVTHAGNLFKPGMFRVLPFGMKTSADVMHAVVASRPTWIVFSTTTAPLYGRNTEVGEILQPVLATDYDLQPSPTGRMIYRLRDPSMRPSGSPADKS